MEQNPLGWRVRIFTGAALAIMAAVAVRVDVLNNWQCVKSWLDRATDKGGELRGGDALKAYRRNGGPMAAVAHGGDGEHRPGTAAQLPNCRLSPKPARRPVHSLSCLFFRLF
jgi:hypothetical protein